MNAIHPQAGGNFGGWQGSGRNPEQAVAALGDLIFDPCWFPDSLDADGGVVEFVRTDRRALAQAPFLDRRFTGGIAQRERAPLEGLLNAVPNSPAPAHFIFHTAFCCSTLLARAVDTPGGTLSLKEPNVLMDLANAKRVSTRLKSDPHLWPALANTVFSLLSRRFEPGESVLVKPTNAVNNLIPDALAFGSSALLLYADLRGFLVSVIKKGESCRSFVRELFNIFSLDPEPLGALPGRQAMKFTDLQVAALVWRHQMEGFVKALRAAPSERLRTLDCAILLDRRKETLAALEAFLRLGLTADTIGAIAEGPVFSVDSKAVNREYDTGRRAAEAGEIEAHYGETLDLIVEWAASVRLGEDVPALMPNALGLSPVSGRSATPAAS